MYKHKQIRLLSERYTSKYLNTNKLKLLREIDFSIISLKNEMSQFISLLIDELFNNPKIIGKCYKFFGNKYLGNWNIQHIFQDICNDYENMFIDKMYTLDLSIQENNKFNIEVYKRNTKKNKKGDIIYFEIVKHSTPLTNLIEILIKYNLNKEIRFKSSKIEDLYNFYCNKFGKERILNLAQNRQNHLLKSCKTIRFNTGTFRVISPSNGYNNGCEFIYDETNLKYRYWFKLHLRKEYGDIYLPVQINSSYHHWDKIRNAQFYVKLNKNKIDIIATKEAKIPIFKDEINIEGIDLNVKNNFATFSNNKIFDYDRKYIKKFIEELNKLDKIGLQNISLSQKKHLNKLVKRNEWYFKKLISEILNYCEENKITDLVMEDLDKFSASYIRNEEFDIKYSRLSRLLRLSNIKNWMLSQAEKRGIRVHISTARYSSQQCRICGYIDKENRQSQEIFKCLQCNHEENADLNSSRNLKFRYTNVLLRNSKLHKFDNYDRMIPEKYLKKEEIKKILTSTNDNIKFTSN